MSRPLFPTSPHLLKQKPLRRIFCPGLLMACAVFWITPAPAGERRIRVATYNIAFLNKNISDARRENLREVVRALDADVIGLCEIDDRAALRLMFPPDDWQIVIDDDSKENQDLALAVRKPLRVKGTADNTRDIDAGPEHFLFKGPEYDTGFPNNRDALCVEIELPDQAGVFHVMVVHLKSRREGRATTEPRRVWAARQFVQRLEREFDEREFILLGDFNDNADDAALNILETGDPNAAGGPEEIDGPFLANLTEPLLAAGHVSWGPTAADLVGDPGHERVNTIDPESRKRNNDFRGANQHTGRILFDQLLIPMRMLKRYRPGSAKVFDHPATVRGGKQDCASDHLPVYADFVFGTAAPASLPATAPAETGAPRIAALLPNPEGDDPGREEITLLNPGDAEIPLDGWKLRDRAGNVFTLSGKLAAHERLTLKPPAGAIPLNNDGDELTLRDPRDQVRQTVSYSAARDGQWITIE